MTLTLELSEAMEAALQTEAITRGMTASEYVRALVYDNVASRLEGEQKKKPLKSGYGMLAKFGPAPSYEEIEENRRDMFRGFGESF